MNINLAYPRKLEDQVPSNQELTVSYLEYAVSNAYPQGLEGQKRRIWGRIQRKLDDVVLDKQDDVSLETSEVELLKDAFSKATFPAGISKFINLLEDTVNSL